jgi:superfamily II DNA helicase RecQ
VVEALLQDNKDVISIAATGSGKTLTFWMPLLFRLDGIQIIITPLNILGKQNVTSLTALGICSITLSAKNEEFKHRVIVTNIEIFWKEDRGFNRLWKNPAFVR